MARRSQSGGILGTLLVSLLIGLTACLLVAFYIAQNVHVTSTNAGHGNSVHVETPAGSVHAREDGIPPESVGIPIYPGAVRVDHGTPSFEFESTEGHGFSYVLAQYETPDSVASVRDFYRKTSPHWIFSNEDNQDPRAEYIAGGYKRVVVLHREKGRTFIALASTGEAAAN